MIYDQVHVYDHLIYVPFPSNAQQVLHSQYFSKCHGPTLTHPITYRCITSNTMDSYTNIYM